MGLNASAFVIGANLFENDIRTDRKLVEAISKGTSGVLLNEVGASLSGFYVSSDPGGHGIIIKAAAEAVLRGRNTLESQGSYFVWGDSDDYVGLPIPQANPYIVSVVLRVVDPQYGVATGDIGARYDLVPGAASSNPVAPSDAQIAAYGGNPPGGWLRLADVRINPGDVGVVPQGQITIRRPFATLNGAVVATSDSRPEAPYHGLKVWEYDLQREIVWDQLNSRWMFSGGKIKWENLGLRTSAYQAFGTQDQGPGGAGTIKIGIGPGHRIILPAARLKSAGASLAIGAGGFSVISLAADGWGNWYSDDILAGYGAGYISYSTASYAPTMFNGSNSSLQVRVGASGTLTNTGSTWLVVPEMSWDAPLTRGV